MAENMWDAEPLDQEWKELILSALDMGITSEEIRNYLSSFSKNSVKLPELSK
ncbi:anti-repressor SinI family protein [Metabacillus sp. RGM 3146]|uniref:anti-repressor SinI family protein n=1 Tax=Metabacillus sp. RGM 3146 TaxID=3401092 RepID=UPI003B99886C